jgi:hypothetical protein
MLRNLPAKDEIFFQKLSEKLEAVRQSRQDDNETPGGVGSSSAPMGIADEAAQCKANEDDDVDKADEDIPIKFKSSSNFGAPFGRM